MLGDETRFTGSIIHQELDGMSLVVDAAMHRLDGTHHPGEVKLGIFSVQFMDPARARQAAECFKRWVEQTVEVSVTIKDMGNERQRVTFEESQQRLILEP